jgi:HEAT repeat protein
LSIEEYLSELRDEGKPLVSTRLSRLSDLSSNDLVLFIDAWSGMGGERRRDIIVKLVEQAEENASLNFDDVFLACLNDADELVRVSAIDGLWECENRSLIDPLIGLLQGDNQESVRAAAAMALGKFTLLAELGELPPGDSSKLQEALTEVIEDKAEKLGVRKRAVEAIAAFNTPEVTEIIQEAYRSDEAKMRVSAIYAMGMNCDPAWLPTLVSELSNPDAELRFEAVGACGEMGEEEVVPDIVSLLNDPDSQVQMSAIAALGKIGSSEAEAAIRRCLEHPDEHVRGVAEEAIEELEYSRDPLSFGIE